MRWCTLLAALAALASFCEAQPWAKPFNYAHHGEDWPQCAISNRQSPIDFAVTAPWGPLGTAEVLDHQLPGEDDKFFFTYDIPDPVKIQNNGHSISIELASHGYGGITFNNGWYNILAVNLHVLSEHTFRGKHFPMEAHIVHKKYDSNAIIAVAVPLTVPGLEEGCDEDNLIKCRLQEIEKPAHATAPLAFLREGIPHAGEALELDGSLLNLKGMFENGDASYFEYAGSLTAPPCLETATWLVKREPMMMDEAALAHVQRVIYNTTSDFGNWRATVPTFDRKFYIRKAVEGEPVATAAPHTMSPTLAAKYKADEVARDAVKQAKKVETQAGELYRRLLNAGRAHTDTMPYAMRVPRPGVGYVPVNPLHASAPERQMTKAVADAVKGAVERTAHKMLTRPEIVAGQR